MNCRHCHTPLSQTFLDLGSAPPSNAYLTQEKLSWPETYFPLRVLVCDRCWLVQTEDFTDAKLLFETDYAYFSSTSVSWLKHAENYVEAMTSRFGLNEQSHVVEVAANDGYLLQYVKQRGIPCTGVEPTATGKSARAKGIDIVESFFGASLAEELVESGKRADLTAANNVLAHVPDINDFVSGFAILLKEDGVSTFEFPHLLNLVKLRQFDTIYHEHFSYLSLTAVDAIFKTNGLQVFDVENLKTHGGSLRVFAQRIDTGKRPVEAAVGELLGIEAAEGMNALQFYQGFQGKVVEIKNKLLSFLLEQKLEGHSVAAYGAAAKGNTFLNYAGLKTDLVDFVVDRSEGKLGKYLPGSHIPVLSEEALRKARPNYILILPWNLSEEIVVQLDYVREWGAKFVTAIPYLTIF